MKTHLITAAAALVCPMAALAQEDGAQADLYFRSYLLARDAEKSNDTQVKLEKLRQAVENLRKLRADFPHWKPDMVKARLERTEQQLAEAAR